MIAYKQNIKNFMQWFRTNHQQIEKMLETGDFQGAEQKMLSELEKGLRGCPFRLSVHKAEHQYILEWMTSFSSLKRIMADVFCSQLPQSLKNTWRFYYYHPPFKEDLVYNGRLFSGADIQLIPIFNDRRKRIDLLVEKTPVWEGLSDTDCFTALSMLLMDYLGELWVDEYLGRIQFLDRFSHRRLKQKTSISLECFEHSLDDELKRRGWHWENTLTVQNYGRLTLARKRRKDIFKGAALCVELLKEESHPDYQSARDFLIANDAALYSIVVRFSVLQSRLVKSKIVEKTEQEIAAAIGLKENGVVINTAIGNAFGYVDFLVFEEMTLNRIQQLIKGKPKMELLQLQQGE